MKKMDLADWFAIILVVLALLVGFYERSNYEKIINSRPSYLHSDRVAK